MTDTGPRFGGLEVGAIVAEGRPDGDPRGLR